MLTVLQFSLLLAAVAVAYPARNSQRDTSKVLYDQRQEGGWNVRADLDNFVILLVPAPILAAATSPGASQPSPASLLDLLTKSLPKGARLKRVKHVKKNHQNNVANEPAASLETQHFIESKTAPYHVDISKTKTHLDVVDSSTEGLTKIWKHGKQKRSSRAFLVTVPDEVIVTLEQDTTSMEKEHIKKRVPKGDDTLKLLGAENEQCGPGLFRDSEGVCRIYGNI